MAESVIDIDLENKLADHRQEDEEKEETNSSLLAGLNLVILLSFFSLSTEERSDFEEIQEPETGIIDHKTKNGVSRSSFHTRQRQVNQFPALERQSKVHTKIRDSRHYRRL